MDSQANRDLVQRSDSALVDIVRCAAAISTNTSPTRYSHRPETVADAVSGGMRDGGLWGIDRLSRFGVAKISKTLMARRCRSGQDLYFLIPSDQHYKLNPLRSSPFS